MMNIQTTPILKLLTDYCFSQTTQITKTSSILRLLQYLKYSQTTPISEYFYSHIAGYTWLLKVYSQAYYNSKINQDYSHLKTAPTLIILPDHSISLILPDQIYSWHRVYSLSQITLKLFPFSDYSQATSILKTLSSLRLFPFPYNPPRLLPESSFLWLLVD